MSTEDRFKLNRRDVMIRTAQGLAGIAVVCAGRRPAAAKAKSNRDDFYYQEEPGEDGHACSGCINFTAKSTGKYGADSGDCDLVLGDVFKNGYCQGWTDVKSPKSKKAGT